MAKKKDSDKHTASENGNARNGDESNFNDPDGFVDDISDEGSCPFRSFSSNYH